MWAEGIGVKIAPGGPAQFIPMRKEAWLEHSRRNWKILLNRGCPSGLKMMKMVQWVKFPRVCGCCPLPLDMNERPSVDQWRASLGDAFTSLEPLPARPLLKASQIAYALTSSLFSKSSQSFVIHISVFFRGPILFCSTLANRTVLH